MNACLRTVRVWLSGSLLRVAIMPCLVAACWQSTVASSVVSRSSTYACAVAAITLQSASNAREGVKETIEPAELNEQMRKSLDSMGRLPWYDSDAGEVEPIPVKPRLDDSSNRDSRWVPKPEKPKKTKTQAKPQQNSNNQRPGFWSSLGTIFGDFSNVLGWVILGLVLALIVGLIVYTVSKMEMTALGEAVTKTEDDEQLEREEKARLENLPVQVQRPTGDLLAEADRLRTAGRLDEAIIYLFGHRLIQLDRAHAIRLARGKTNRQYINELRKRPDLRSVLENTVQIFEQSYFGRYPISSDDYDKVRSLQGSFESSLATQREAA